MGQISGLKLPQQETTGQWSMMPYVLAGHNIPDDEGKNQEKLSTAGIDIRYEPRSDLTSILSINPDFTQLERQITDIDFSYIEKAVSDIRPFFQEGPSFCLSQRLSFNVFNLVSICVNVGLISAVSIEIY